MNRKTIIVGLVVVVAAGLGIYALVKSHGNASEAGADESAPAIVTVQTGALKLATLHRYVQGYGMIEPAPATAELPAASSQLAAPSAGIVTKLNVIAGQQVTKGDVLVELNSGTTTVENAAQQVERQKQLYAQQNTSLKNLQDAEAQLALLQVTAPLSGSVVSVNVKPGQAVDASTVVAEVMDLNRLAVSAKIPAAQAGELKTGEEVQIGRAIDGRDGSPTTASLSFVSPAVDANDGTVSAWAALPPDSGLRPGQFVELKIVTMVKTNCLAAPAESVVTDEDGKSFIALVKSGEAMQTPVKIGLRESDWVEVDAPGLKEGDTVVTVGAYGLPDKAKIQIANSSADEASATNSAAAQ
ncbi:MAG TPA: efflux RND transporter periplasmic adaptor subunit [Verrucomicrobiae bacterium]